MSIQELDKILQKDPIISTYGAGDLINHPNKVLAEYQIHASTHLSLGDTAIYVDRIFKWVTGANKGAFIGAVLGDYGEGKTSFQVHIWEQSNERKVLAVPPFQWSKFEDITNAIAGWVKFILESKRPDLALEVEKQYKNFMANTIEVTARKLVETNHIDYDEALRVITAALEAGAIQLAGIDARTVINFLEILSEIIARADYAGILVLLDEPEVAARHLGNEIVQGFIFDLADILHQRQGNYGVFLSMPQNFYAACNNRFQALPARLQARQCFPRLGDIFGPSFAEDLWNRYIDKFALGNDGNNIVDAWALKAIGQIGSTACRHLCYGPRTVVSAFNSMVAKYINNKTPYTTTDLLLDIKNQEIMTQPEYRTSLNGILNSQDVTDENREAVEFLAVFPNGLKTEELRQLNYEQVLRPLQAGSGLIQITAHTMAFRELKPAGSSPGDILEEVIQGYDDEFAPGLLAKRRALSAFAKYLVPEIFKSRVGQALNGWVDHENIRDIGGGTIYFGTKIGAFDEMSKTFPQRALMVAVGSPEARFAEITVPNLQQTTGPVTYDLLFKFVIHSDNESHNEEIDLINVQIPILRENPIVFKINLDVFSHAIPIEYLSNLVEKDRLNPLFLLGLLEQMALQTFPMEHQNVWETIRKEIVRELIKTFFGIEFSDQLKNILSSEYQINIAEAGMGLIDKASAALLFRKYPNYSTLIRQSQWTPKVSNIISALEHPNIPLECKRGKRIWKAPAQELEHALHTSVMNISGGAFDNFGNLIKIKSPGGQLPREVTFLIHPFEQEIANIINSENNDDRIKVDNIECPCLSIRVNLLDRLLEYGYTIEELAKIIEIGVARKSFEKTNRGREEVLFCRPLDLEDLKENLKNKLKTLENEVTEMRKISWYRLNFDIEDTYLKIENIQNDTDHDAQNRYIDGQKAEHNNQVRLVSSKFMGEIDSNISFPLANSKKGLTEDRRILSLRIIEAKSPWINNLNEYIVPNFQRCLNQTKNTYDEIQQKGEQLKRKLSDIETISRNDVIPLLVDCYDEYIPLKAKWDSTQEEVNQFFSNLKLFEEWLKLKNESDIIYTNILELKNTREHEEMSEELLMGFTSISETIGDHLRLTNIGGLKDYDRFRQLLIGIEKKREDYLSHLRVEFNNRKNKINELFQSLNLEPLKNVFDQSNTKQSYDTLFKDAIGKLQSDCFGKLRNELFIREMDIRYSSHILNTITQEEADELLLKKRDMQEELVQNENKLSKDRLAEILAEEKPEIIDLVQRAYKLSDDYYRKIMDATRPKVLTDEKLITLKKEIEENNEIDLKSLILFVSNMAEKPQLALDETLASLSELFKSNNVEIKVKSRKR